MLKSYGVGCGGVVAHEILVSAQGPLVLGFCGLGLWVWGLGLTKSYLVVGGGGSTHYKPYLISGSCLRTRLRSFDIACLSKIVK